MTRRQNVRQENSQEVPNAAEDTAIQRCLDAASESIQLITTYWRSETKNVLACWYGLYFLVSGILFCTFYTDTRSSRQP